MKNFSGFRLWVGVALCYMISLQALSAQEKESRPSPPAKAAADLNGNDIVITYSSPSVKGREIWGGLVPFERVWRTGANENTTISFSKPVLIEGKKLPAGTYGLHSIPSKNEWIIIFSSDSKEWGSFSYKQERDALRVTVKPTENEFRERLGFTIEISNDQKARAVMAWERLKISFNIENAN